MRLQLQHLITYTCNFSGQFQRIHTTSYHQVSQWSKLFRCQAQIIIQIIMDDLRALVKSRSISSFLLLSSAPEESYDQVVADLSYVHPHCPHKYLPVPIAAVLLVPIIRLANNLFIICTNSWNFSLTKNHLFTPS